MSLISMNPEVRCQLDLNVKSLHKVEVGKLGFIVRINEVVCSRERMFFEKVEDRRLF